MTDSGHSQFRCSTSGTAFSNKDDLTEHYKSELHRYNLKRKVAGLPPVTADWFEQRRAHLTALRPVLSGPEVYICPLTRKKFHTKATYDVHTRSRKYKAAMRAAGLADPLGPRLLHPEARDGPNANQTQVTKASDLAHQLHGLARGRAASVGTPQSNGSAGVKGVLLDAREAISDSDEEAVNDSGWETDDSYVGNGTEEEGKMSCSSTGDMPVNAANWEQWDLCQSLFDDHVSPTFADNLAYMYKMFGFYFPDVKYLTDPEGLLRYLGAKMQYGLIPLYVRGNDVAVKQFRSLHAVQRHMVDTNQCRMAYAGDVDEYDDYYVYPDDAGNKLLHGPQVSMVSSELVLRSNGQVSKTLGTREFSKYYKQRFGCSNHVQTTARQLQLAYHNFGLPAVAKEEVERRSRQHNYERRRQWVTLKAQMKNDKIHNLPKNVTF